MPIGSALRRGFTLENNPKNLGQSYKTIDLQYRLGRENAKTLKKYVDHMDRPFCDHFIWESTLTRPQGYKIIFVLNSIEHGIFPAH